MASYTTRFTALLESLEPVDRAALLRVATTFAGPAGFLRIGDLPPPVELERLRQAIRDSVPNRPRDRPFITRVRNLAGELGALGEGLTTLAYLAHGDWRGSDALADAVAEAAEEALAVASMLADICDDPTGAGA